MLAEFQSGLSAEEQESYERLISGERFLGRKSLMNRLEVYLADFRGI
ncbi:hypothetical protein [Streptococcus sp. DD13]|nr:hypothetical protein [Streptococcus sp. DD13]KXT77116.1 hypothetical protein STRDD13_01649 [Streptococcus sp. DD13]